MHAGSEVADLVADDNGPVVRDSKFGGGMPEERGVGLVGDHQADVGQGRGGSVSAPSPPTAGRWRRGCVNFPCPETRQLPHPAPFSDAYVS